MKILPPVSQDPIKELENIQEILFRIAVNLENEKCGNAAMVVALMANRTRSVMEHLERDKANAASSSPN